MAFTVQPRKAGSPVARSKSPFTDALASAKPSAPFSATAWLERNRSTVETVPLKDIGVPVQTARASNRNGLVMLSSAAEALMSESAISSAPVGSDSRNRERSSETPLRLRSLGSTVVPPPSPLSKTGSPAIPPSADRRRSTFASASRSLVTLRSRRSRSRVLSASEAEPAVAKGGRLGSVASMTKSSMSNLISGMAASRILPLS